MPLQLHSKKGQPDRLIMSKTTSDLTLIITSWWFQPTHLKNMSQFGSFPQVGMNIKKIFETTTCWFRIQAHPYYSAL